MRIIIARSCVCAALFVLVAASLSGCGDSGGGDGSCDPATDDACVCETEGGGFCDDPDDLDGFCFLDDGGNNGGNNGATDQATVNIADFAFSPTNVTVNAGGQVQSASHCGCRVTWPDRPRSRSPGFAGKWPDRQ